MCRPKREKIAGGEKITFEPTHIIKGLVEFYSFYTFWNTYKGLLHTRNKIVKTPLRRPEILIHERE